MAWIITALVICIIVILLLILNVRIRVYYRYQKTNHFITVDIYYIRLRIIHRKLILNDESQKEKTSILDMLEEMDLEDYKDMKQVVQTVIPSFKEVKKIIKMMMKSIVIHQLSWRTDFGTGDAASTGIMSGGVWMMKGTVVSFFHELSNLSCQPKLSVTPHFQQRGLYSEIDCIVSIRLGKAIHTGLRLLRNSNFNKEIYT
ncbi:DUF2953 domain-containing protein [Ornithinibacillus sp. BX22]|uniref:DUF2953 domain-containing protein n=1 Tax=Ornithinibacillus hominis TaxID=2763055 RepID=A0A923L8R3_9BACI|nr:DUF2953 domain-containing protein [Ornithinibacillus hominis]MBC5638643.1 DUF2953 domain-containing protein [Ornithinibacillus hominis]